MNVCSNSLFKHYCSLCICSEEVGSMANKRNVNKYKNVLQNEKYMDDVLEAVLANSKKRLLQKQQMCIWGSDHSFLNLENKFDPVQTERSKIFEKMFKTENISSSTQEISKGNEKNLRGVGIQRSYVDDRRPPKSFSTKEDQNHRCAELQNDQIDEEYEKVLKKPIPNKILTAESEDFSREVSSLAKGDGFSEWCKKRQDSFKSRASIRSENKAHNNKLTNKRNRQKSKSPASDTRQKIPSVDPRRTVKYSKSKSQGDISGSTLRTQVCIKVTDERNDQSQEFTVDVTDLSRIKRYFPKLKEVLPDVDAGNKTAKCSLEAINFILKFVFFRCYNKEAMPSPAIGVEIIAAIKAWEIKELQQRFLKDFIQKILSTSNVNSVFSQATHYGLNEICETCKEIAVDSISVNCSTYKRKQKNCFISISTYTEPLEFTIPFHPIKKIFELSFERPIRNTLKFQALSGSFKIIGIHVQLNNDHLEKCSNLNMLEIDYTTKNISEDREIEIGRCEKPQRHINVIYFNKQLVVNPNQIVEITVETDTKPYLCSAFSKEIELKKQERGAEFCLTIDRDSKLPRSGEIICIIGKLLYNVTE